MIPSRSFKKKGGDRAQVDCRVPAWSLRRARSEDAATVARHRFPTLLPSAPALDTYAAWVADALAREVSLGWLAEQEGVILAGVGLTLLEWGPTHDDPNPWRARLVNVFTEPASRRQGLAHALTAHALGEAEARGVRSVSQAATREVRSLYGVRGVRLRALPGGDAPEARRSGAASRVKPLHWRGDDRGSPQRARPAQGALPRDSL